MFELTKSRQGLQEQNNMLLAAANLHTKLVRDNSKVISLSPNQRKKLIKDGMSEQMKGLGYSTGFIRKHFVLFRAYELYEDFYFYFVDRFEQENASMGDVQLSMLTLANEYLEHEFKNKGYANIFDFLKRDDYSKKILNEYIPPNKSSKFKWEDVTEFLWWDGMPAVVLSDGSSKTAFSISSPDREWREVDLADVSTEATILSESSFQSQLEAFMALEQKPFQDNWMEQVEKSLDVTPEEWEEHLHKTKLEEERNDFQDNWMDGVDEALENLTQEEWERLQDETAAQEIQDAHKLSSEKSNSSGIYTRYALKKDIQKYTKEDENHLEDGSINWKYVSADAMIVYGDEMDIDTIYETLEEVAQDIDPKKINYIKQLKKEFIDRVK